MRIRSIRTLRLGAVVLSVAVIAGLAQPAGAHDEEGTMTVTMAEQTATDRVRVEVGLVYTNDGHLAEAATVNATLTGSDGQVVGPVDLPRTSGSLYGGEIDVPGPGPWQVALTSTEPASTGEATIDVTATSDTTVPPATVSPQTTAPPATANGDPTETTEPDEADAALLAASTDDGGSGGDSGGAILVAGALGLLVIAAIAAFVVYRRRAAAPV